MKWWLARILAVSLWILAVGDFAYAQTDTAAYTLPGPESTLEAALRGLIDAGAGLTYRPGAVPERLITIPDAPLITEDWLTLLLQDTELTFVRSAAGFLILARDPGQPIEYSLYGIVTDARSGERLIGATVQLPEQRRGTHTNEYGFYSLVATGGESALRITYVGYVPRVISIRSGIDSLLDIALVPNQELPQIIVTAGEVEEGEAAYFETGIRIGRAEVEQLSGPGGQDDPLQLARLLPGVTSGADGIGGALIRGSEAGHNQILLDGVPVFGLNHAGGLFSIFSNLAIRRIDLYKDGIPARFGDRIGGVLDVHTRDGNLYEHEVNLGGNLLAGQVAAEGPLTVGQSSYLITGRYFWAGPVLSRFSERYKADRGRSGRTDYDVYDLNFKLNQQAGKRGRIYLSVYRGLDNYENTTARVQNFQDTSEVGTPFAYRAASYRSEAVRWGNTVAALRYNHVFSDRMFGNFRLSYSDLRTSSTFGRQDSLTESASEVEDARVFSGVYRSDIRQLGMAFDGQYSMPDDHRLRFGIEGNAFRFDPRLNNGDSSSDELRVELMGMRNTVHRPLQLTAYGSLEGDFDKRLYYRLGLRGSRWQNGASGHTYLSPRVLLAGPLVGRVDWQATYDRSVQPVHLLNSFVIGLPSDLWVPSTETIAPATAPQVSAKLKYRAARPWLLTTSLYYRKLKGLVAYAEGAQSQPDWIDNLSHGNGRAYGWESMVQRSSGKLRGWLSYTLARSDRTFDERINQGETFPFRHDRRHALNLIAIWQLGERTTLTGSWRFESGLAYSLSDEVLPTLDDDQGNERLYTRERNGFRMPPNHRLDINLHTVISKPGSPLTHSFDVGVYNLYDRHNPVYFDPRPEYEQLADGSLNSTIQDYQIYVAPLLPTLSYRLTIRSGNRSIFGR